MFVVFTKVFFQSIKTSTSVGGGKNIFPDKYPLATLEN